MDISGYQMINKNAWNITPSDFDGVEAVITDPPYGIALDSHCKRGVKDRKPTYKIEGDSDQGVGIHVLNAAREAGVPFIVAFASPQKPWPGKFRNWVVWDKGGGVGFGGDTKTCFRRTWELIQIENSKEISGRPESVWRCPPNNAIYKQHPCAKPVKLLSKIITTLGISGAVFDPFAGSGSTGVACVELGLPFTGWEIDTQHFNTASRRLTEAINEKTKQGQLF